MVSLPHAVLVLTMCHKIARCDFHSALWAFHPPPMVLLKRWTLPPYPSRIGLIRQPTWSVAWLADHDSRLRRVCLQANLV